jgi:hypothetical protein
MASRRNSPGRTCQGPDGRDRHLKTGARRRNRGADPRCGWPRAARADGPTRRAGGVHAQQVRFSRFDARFFLADADRLASDPDDFSRASDELAHLRWVPLGELKRLDLPFITQVVLAETTARLPDLGPPETVPFFRNDDEEIHFHRLGGRGPFEA